MQTFSSFRGRLAQRLRERAARRERACGADPSGEDLKILALLDRLARDAERLPSCLISEAERVCRDPACARRFDQAWDILPDTIGVILVPHDAVDLLRWLIDQARSGPDLDGAPDQRWPEPRAGVRADRLSRRAERLAPSRDGLLLTAATDFTGGLGTVAPMLSVWQLARTIGQWRDQAFAASHPATAATVVSVAADEAGRGAAPLTETIAFTPVGGQAECRVPIRLHGRQADPIGQAMTVVPRSADCEPPLVPEDIGNPGVGLLVAIAYLAAGLVSLKVWTWLLRRRRFSRPPAIRPHAGMRVAS